MRRRRFIKAGMVAGMGLAPIGTVQATSAVEQQGPPEHTEGFAQNAAGPSEPNREETIAEPELVNTDSQYEYYLFEEGDDRWIIRVDTQSGRTSRAPESTVSAELSGRDSLSVDSTLDAQSVGTASYHTGVIDKTDSFSGYFEQCSLDNCKHRVTGTSVRFNKYVAAASTSLIAGEIMAVLKGVKYLNLILNSDRVARILGAVGGVAAGDSLSIGSYESDVFGRWRRNQTGYSPTWKPSPSHIVPLWSTSGHEIGFDTFQGC